MDYKDPRKDYTKAFVWFMILLTTIVIWSFLIDFILEQIK